VGSVRFVGSFRETL